MELPFLTGYAKVLENCLGKHTFSQIVYGNRVSSTEALALDIVQHVYQEPAQLEQIIKKFAKEFLPRSANRALIS